MNLSIVVTLLVVLLFVNAWYSTNKKRNQILCRYFSKDKTVEEKWIGSDKGFIVFRGRKFDVITRRISSFWLNKGIHWLFPTKVNYLQYSWYSRFPHDPDNYENVWETPEVRNAINTSELVQSFYRTATPSPMKKQGMLQTWLPFISIILVVLIAFWLYSNQQQLAAQLGAMQNTLNAITK